jgi:hypothetical protein
MDEVALLRDIGPKLNARLALCASEVASLRTELMQIHRRLTLAPLRRAFSNPSSSEIQTDFLSYIFRPLQLPLFPGFSRLTQNAGFLLTFLHDNPHVFVQAVLARSKSASFPYLVNCAIPAVFGYFISGENLSHAVRFYQLVIERASDRQAVSILEPLFRSPVTFRFLESAFSSVIGALVLHMNANAAEPPCIPIYSTSLVDSIVESAGLLPQEILDLITHTQRLKWSRKRVTVLLFDCLLGPYAELAVCVAATPRHAALLRRVLEAISQDQSHMSAIMRAFTTRYSMAAIPRLYLCFGHKYLDALLSPHDLRVLAEALASARLLPDTVIRSELSAPSPELEFSVFSIRIYPRASRPERALPHPPLFAADSPEIALLERLLFRTHHKRGLQRWLLVSASCEEIASAPIVAALAHRPPARPFLESLGALRAAVPVKRLARQLYLALLARRLARLVDGGLAVALDLLDAEFLAICARLRGRAGLPRLADLGAARPLAVDAVRRLACLDSAALHQRFVIVLQTIEHLTRIEALRGTPDLIGPFLFRENQARQFLSTFVLLSTFAMNKPTFNEMCTDAERRLWVRLQAVTLAVLNADDVLLAAYSAMHDRLGETAAAELE